MSQTGSALIKIGMSLRARFERERPGVFYLDTTNVDELRQHLMFLGWMGPKESILQAEKAGEGNMNFTVRVRTPERSFILKQARPWVEKYPLIDAPWDRALVEGRFYELVASHPELACRMPRLLGLDPYARLLCLEDLGEARDFTAVYGGSPLPEPDLRVLIEFLTGLHAAFRNCLARDVFENRAMRGLNHQHIFVLPLEDGNGLELDRITPGLTAAARKLRHDAEYKRKVLEAGELYLAGGPCLLHGDYFPGSWLSTAAGLKIIDPEFCFFGPH